MRVEFFALVASAVAVAPPPQKWPELLPYEPVALPSQQVISGDIRFTVLSPRLVRIEQKHVGTSSFEDRATTAVLHRATSASFEHSVAADDVLTLETSALRLTYCPRCPSEIGHAEPRDALSRPLSPQTLSVTSKDPGSAFQSWSFGQTSQLDGRNLLGTIRSLDNVGPISLNCTDTRNKEVHDESLHCEWGLVSRSGWAVFDDSDTRTLDPISGWWADENTNNVDLYLFAHGHDYKAALRDFVAISGKPAMPPRAAMGVWWTRWYNMNEGDVKGVVDEYEMHSVPLDVFVLDMDWHTKEKWGGYTWDRRIFPNPKHLMTDFLKGKKGLTTMVNLHDNDGVSVLEEKHDAVARAMGLDPETCGHIDFAMCSNETYAEVLEDVVIKSLEDDGVDYMWIDWQQGGAQGGCTGAKHNPTIWTNKIRSTDPIRRGSDKRGMVLARWGGLGSHRYPVGFSADYWLPIISSEESKSWANLAFQPYFSLTAANVAYGLWSHDIFAQTPHYELYTRWVQWGSYSAVLRSHDRGESAGMCNYGVIDAFHKCSAFVPWDVPNEYFKITRAASRAREALVPYIYTALAQLSETGLGLLRPMYYEYPELEHAYKAAPDGSFAQYFFGDDLIVAPVVNKALGRIGIADHLAHKTIWVPPGEWIEQDTGAVRVGSDTGNTLFHGRFHLSEVPVLVRAGAVIARRPMPDSGSGSVTGLASQAYTALEFSVFPGASSGETSVYEDDGATTAYLDGNKANILAKYTTNSTSITFTVSTDHSFHGQPQQRAVTLRLVNAPPPQSVLHTVSEQPAESVLFEAFGGVKTWSYDGPAATLVIEVAPADVNKPQSIVVDFSEDMASLWRTGALAGLRGAISHANLAKGELDKVRKMDSDTGRGELDRMSVVGEILSYSAGQDDGLAEWNRTVSGARSQLAAALKEVKKLSMWGVNIASHEVPLPVEAGFGRKRCVKHLLKDSLNALQASVESILI